MKLEPAYAGTLHGALIGSERPLWAEGGDPAIHPLLAHYLAPHGAPDPRVVAMGAAGAAFLGTLLIEARARRRGLRVYRAVARAGARPGGLTTGERAILAAVAQSLRLEARAVAQVDRELLQPKG